MTVTNFSKSKSIPKVTTKKSSPTTTNFAKGIYTYKPNDLMAYDEIYLAQNARFDRIGEYKTRRGVNPLLDYQVVGLTKTYDNYDQDNYEMVSVDEVSQTITYNGYTSVPHDITVMVAATNSTDYGRLQLELYDRYGALVGTSCTYDLTTTPTGRNFILPALENASSYSTYTIKFRTQSGGKQKFKIAVLPGTTNLMYILRSAPRGKIENLFGTSYEASPSIGIEHSFLFTVKPYLGAPALYYCDRFGSNITKIRDLPMNTEKVRFVQAGEKVYYADGQEGPRVIDLATWTDSAVPTTDLKTGVDLSIKVSNILYGTQDNLMFFDADTDTQAVWTYPYGFSYAPEADFTTSSTLNAYVPGATTTTTVAKSTLTPTSDTHLVSSLAVNDIVKDGSKNYGKVTTISSNDVTVTSISHIAEPINSYTAFDRDFRQNFPAIKTGDPLTAMFNLGGVVYFLTRRHKYYMISQTADSWTQQASLAQHGTFSQESCVCDLNYAYYACDDGIYVFDGTSETSITQNSIQKTYDAIPNKHTIRLQLFNNRLYVFYPKETQGRLSSKTNCLVYNVNLRLWESFDTKLPIASAMVLTRQNASSRLICGSNAFGQLLLFEEDTNNYSDLGAPIDFDLETSYLHFGTPSQLHRITKWRPEFAKTDGDYTIKCGYALDFTDDVKYAFSINLRNNTPVNEHYVWDNPPNYGNPVAPTKLSTVPQVNGQFYRCQIRYQHHAAFEPVNFKSHTLSCETQRLR